MASIYFKAVVNCMDGILDIYDMIQTSLNLYHEMLEIEEAILGRININIVNSIPNTVFNVRPDLIDRGLDIDALENLSGYTLFLPDNSISVLIDESTLINNFIKNFCWIETLIHEYTHAVDYLTYFKVTKACSLDEMLTDLPFWWWSEFHARYLGNIIMLYFVKELPKNQQIQYNTQIFENVDSYLKSLNTSIGPQMKMYQTMHIIADIAAFRELNPDEMVGVASTIYSIHDWFLTLENGTLASKSTFNVDTNKFLISQYQHLETRAFNCTFSRWK